MSSGSGQSVPVKYHSVPTISQGDLPHIFYTFNIGSYVNAVLLSYLLNSCGSNYIIHDDVIFS